MKTSNILMTVAILAFFSALLFYDFQLKAEYQTMTKMGLSKYHLANRFNNYDTVKIDGLKNFDLRSSNDVDIVFEHGDHEAVYVRKSAEGMVSITKIDGKIVIDLTKKGREQNFQYHNFTIVIISPEIKSVYCSASIAPKTDSGDKKGPASYKSYGITSISGFKQDSINLYIKDENTVELNDNVLKHLNATVGDNKSDGTLKVKSSNNIESVKLSVQRKSSVEILDTDVKSFEPLISDSAKVTFRGMALKKLAGSKF